MRSVGLELLRARRRAGLTQRAVARALGTTQSAVSRAETGQVSPTADFVHRYARACGEPITITFGAPARDAEARRERVRRGLGDFVFDPWERGPTPEEAKTLIADGLEPGSGQRR